jgi:polyphosphate kinase
MSEPDKNSYQATSAKKALINQQAMVGGEINIQKQFFNRELSLLEFHRRVLEEALDNTQPILERIKFLAIFSSIMDEFFMIRVSGLKEELEQGVNKLSPDGLTTEEELRAIRKLIEPMMLEQMRCYHEEILPELQANGITISSYDSLSNEERKSVDNYFMRSVFPVLTPQAVDPAHPFPYISGLSLNLALMVEPIPQHGITRSLTGKVERRFVRIKVPPVIPGLIPVDQNRSKFIFLWDLIAANINHLFPRMAVSKCHLFRVTRDADIEVRDEEADDILQSVQQTIQKRRFGTAVRLEVSSSMPREMMDYLTNSIGLVADDLYVLDGPLNISDLMALYKLDRPELKDKPIKVDVPARLKRNTSSIFEAIKERDILLHHPYASYDTVINFIESASKDPDVLAIKMCLYRTGQKSAIPQALIEASERGKQVTALVELKARFDEENNIEWAKRLENAGVHVVYGLVGLKTHAKLALVVRREDDELRHYVHIATGNYNPSTASVYTDFGLLTSDEEIGTDATELFNFLTGYSRQKEYRQLLVAPVNLRENLYKLIDREIEHSKAGRPARIIAKVNRIADPKMVHKLYEASKAGVSIDLIVRGICTLRPGIPGLSENIRVRSIVGRFLEHSRIFYFANNGKEDTFIGSADFMTRNLDRRVEVVVPINDPGIKEYLKDTVLDAYLRDNTKARLLQPDGSYQRVQRRTEEEVFNSQLFFEGKIDIK